MKGTMAKRLAGALLLAGSMAMGASAMAATATPAPAPAATHEHDARAKCEHEGKDKGLKGEKLAGFVKKCEAAPASAKKAS